MTETRPGIRALLGGNRDYRRLLLAGLISQAGDWVVGTGLAFHVYRLTGSTLSTAIMLLASRLPDVAGDDRRGSVFGILGSAQAATALAGMVLAGMLGGAIGVVPALFLHAAGLIAAGTMALAWNHA